MTIAEAISRIYHLRVDTTTRDGDGSPHEKPHKPLLLLAAMDLIDEGQATPDRILWSQSLRDRFTARFAIARRLNDENNPALPFRHLASDGIWLPLEANGFTRINRLVRVRDDSERVFARFINGFDVVVAVPEFRRQLREAIVSRYFPWAATLLLTGRPRLDEADPLPKVAEEPAEYGRSAAFRRTILNIYDHQCAACGLRIKLSSGNDVSFIDAAHLLPWDRFRNDHPTNGLALCKNHHWAMDRDIIAPSPDLHWHISRLLDPRRSNGERELYDISGKSLLLPKDPAYHPDKEGLHWRIKQLVH